MSPESISGQLWESATLMLVGMGVVFIFLAILIVAVNLLAKFCQLFPGEQPQAPTKRASSGKSSSTPTHGTDPKVIAAITAAVHTHRQSNR